MNKRFVYFSTKVKFEQATLGTEYDFTSIVFIGDTKEIWNRGILYATPNDFDIADYLTKAEAASTYQPVGDYAVKSEVEAVLTKLNEYMTEANTKIADRYTKNEVDTKIDNVNVRFNDYTKSDEIVAKLALKADINYADEIRDNLKRWVEDKKYLTEHQSLEDYSTTTEVEGLISTAKSEILGGAGSDYDTLKEIETWIGEHQDLYDALVAANATKGFVESEIGKLEGVYQPLGDYITEHQSLDNYYNKTQVDGLVEGVRNDIPSLEGYATEQWVENKKYLQTHQSLSDYAKTSEVDTKLEGYYTKDEVEEMFEWAEY